MNTGLVLAAFTWSWSLTFEYIRYRIIPRTVTILRYFNTDDSYNTHNTRCARSVLQVVGRHPTGFA